MSTKPIFVATHPRACSTAFERVFMTRQDTLTCIHEPFGDAFYYGPERLSSRFENDPEIREESGFAQTTFKTVFDQIQEQETEGKRVFIKDIIHYLLPPGGKPASIAPSLQRLKRGVGTNSHETNGVNGVHHSPTYPYDTEPEPGNPTVVPAEMLARFHFTFLIRDPHSSIPSYYRCTIPPLDEMTGFHNFDPLEAGYDETRRVFDFLRKIGHVGPHSAHEGSVTANGDTKGVEVCVIDADDLLDDPEAVIKRFCQSVGLKFEPEMLNWDNEEDQTRARKVFAKWKGFHEDAIESKDLKPRVHKHKAKSEEQWDAEWKDKYGDDGAKLIRETVDKNMADYHYLKQFAMKV